MMKINQKSVCVRLLPYEYVCINGHAFIDYGLSDFAYGSFILRNSNNEVRYSLAIEDIVFQEVCKLVEYDEHILCDKDLNDAELVQYVYSMTCDYAIDSGPFIVGQLPKCPTCRAEVKDWGDTSLGPKDMDVLPVTHYEWNQLTFREREAKVSEAIEEFINDNYERVES